MTVLCVNCRYYDAADATCGAPRHVSTDLVTGERKFKPARSFRYLGPTPIPDCPEFKEGEPTNVRLLSKRGLDQRKDR